MSRRAFSQPLYQPTPKRDQEPPRSLDRPSRGTQELGIAGSPLLTTEEAACYVRRYEGRPVAFSKFARRWLLPCVWVGRMRFYRRSELEVFLTRSTGRLGRFR